MCFGYRSYNRVGPVGSLDLMQEYENYTSLLEQKNIPLYVWVCISKRFFLRCAMEGGGGGGWVWSEDFGCVAIKSSHTFMRLSIIGQQTGRQFSKVPTL